MNSVLLDVIATEQNFDEDAYLRANPDVVAGIQQGTVASGFTHFGAFGSKEGRKLRDPHSLLATAKARKRERIASILRKDLPFAESPACYDFLTESLRNQFGIIDTAAVSSNDYDGYALQLIDENADGLVLDCGAGKRSVYFDNVVNFEIVDYDTTDVRGVGEVLPFVDGSFDAVISIAVLEHVKDPFACAKEIARVLKPGGKLMCCVPFLQPLHGYPNHYYNMTHQGLRNLFCDALQIDDILVYDSVLPIWSLTWMLRSWADGLDPRTRSDFMEMRVADLMKDPAHYLRMPFVQALSPEKNRELASANVLFAHKAT
jgi:SAM-dependent methyltransferase